jgi:hypothetical protein
MGEKPSEQLTVTGEQDAIASSCRRRMLSDGTGCTASRHADTR